MGPAAPDGRLRLGLPRRLTDCTVSETEVRRGSQHGHHASRSGRRFPVAPYHSEETYRLDQERVFYRNWIYVGRAERLPKPGSWMRVEIGGESLLIVRGKDEQIRGFYNVCRHRGSRICDDEQGFARTHLRCPYHAWGYALDGTLVTTPMIEKDEIDREHDLAVAGARRRLGGVRLRQPLARGAASAARAPRRPAGRRARTWPGSGWPSCASGTSPPIDVQANWKIVHRELQRVPALPDDPPRAGRGRPGVQEGLHLRGRPRRRRGLPGRRTYGDGHRPAAAAARCCPASRSRAIPRPTTARMVYPTMFLDVDGSTCLATAVFPTGPRSCRLVTEYLFNPEALEDPEFDPTPVVEFNELVTRQDNEACERVQRGRHLAGLRPRRVPRQGRLGLRLRRALPARRRGLSRGRRGRRARALLTAPASNGLISSSASSGCAAATRETALTAAASASRSTGVLPRSPVSSGAPRSDSTSRRAWSTADGRERARGVGEHLGVDAAEPDHQRPARRSGRARSPRSARPRRSRSAIASTETAGGASRATRSSYAARAACSSAETEHHSAGVGLVHLTERLEHEREPGHGERRRRARHGCARCARPGTRCRRRRTAPSPRRTTGR